MKIIEFIKKYWKPIVAVVLALVIGIQCSSIKELKKENKRINTNFYAMCDTATAYKTKSGKLATQTKNMEVTYNELVAVYCDAKKEIKDLNIKIKNLESYQKGLVEKEIHDTIMLHDTVIDNTLFKTGVYSDGCTDLTFSVSNNFSTFDLSSHDNIDILISIEKEGKWYQFWKWPRNKNYVTTATSACQNTRVTINSCKLKK